jgi:hypothetical protein
MRVLGGSSQESHFLGERGVNCALREKWMHLHRLLITSESTHKQSI